jgi:hypothetical protein
MLHFIYCCAECRYAEYRYAECLLGYVVPALVLKIENTYISLLANVRLGWKDMPRTNTLAFLVLYM